MGYFYCKKYIDLKSKGITADILMEILDIDKESAEDLMEGVIAFTKSEIKKIASYKGVSIKSLISRNSDNYVS